VNVRNSQSVYRAPYVYFAQSAEGPRVVRIGQTMRPGYELQRMQARYSSAVQWLCGVRAFAVLAPILWARFAYCSVGRQWFAPDRRLLLMIERLSARDPERLLTPDQLRAVFVGVFPESPYAGIAQYRMSETYLRRSRVSTDDAAGMGK
jgi:hypothetical protein